MDEVSLFKKLDRIIFLLEKSVKEPSIGKRVIDGSATGVGILGILSAIEIIRSWIGG